jgi:hypothetical protein
MTDNFRYESEKHCEYTKKLLSFTNQPMTEREQFLYVEAMIHGYKHGKCDK